MSKTNRHRSKKLRSLMEEMTDLREEAQQHAMRAEDVLTAAEDREQRRASRNVNTDPRAQITHN